jgi:hypothetical protein
MRQSRLRCALWFNPLALQINQGGKNHAVEDQGSDDGQAQEPLCVGQLQRGHFDESIPNNEDSTGKNHRLGHHQPYSLGADSALQDLANHRQTFLVDMN